MNLINICSTFTFDTVKLNVAGILLILIGTYFLYKFSPKNTHKIDGGNASTNFADLEKKAKKNNNFMTSGFVLILIGTLIQVIILFC